MSTKYLPLFLFWAEAHKSKLICSLVNKRSWFTVLSDSVPTCLAFSQNTALACPLVYRRQVLPFELFSILLLICPAYIASYYICFILFLSCSFLFFFFILLISDFVNSFGLFCILCYIWPFLLTQITITVFVEKTHLR